MEMFEKSKPLIGFWCQFFDQFAIRKICNLNYDWLALDMEHGVYNYKDVCVLTSIIKDYGKIPFVRLNKSNEESVQKSLDSGASGLILPMIENPSSLKKLIKKSSYPPIGNRSVGFSNSNMFGLNLSNDLNSKSRPYIVIQIESVSGVDNLSDLINIDGFDAIMIGPYDLSASLGCPGDFQNKKFIDCINKINKLIFESKLYNGYHIVTPDEQDLKNKIKSGYKFIAYGTDGSFINSKFSIPL